MMRRARKNHFVCRSAGSLRNGRFFICLIPVPLSYLATWPPFLGVLYFQVQFSF